MNLSQSEDDLNGGGDDDEDDDDGAQCPGVRVIWKMRPLLRVICLR